MARADISLIVPGMGKTPESLPRSLQYLSYGCAILDIDSVHRRSEHQAEGIDQEVPLATAEILGTLVRADPTHARGLDRLAVHDAPARLRMLALPNPFLLPEDRMGALPHAIQRSGSKSGTGPSSTAGIPAAVDASDSEPGLPRSSRCKASVCSTSPGVLLARQLG
jgi:hypothetical protein